MGDIEKKKNLLFNFIRNSTMGKIVYGYNMLKQHNDINNAVNKGRKEEEEKMNAYKIDNDAENKKIQLIKRLTNQGYNLQVMAANALKEFLASERAREEAERLEFERQQKEKDRILRRIMDSNVRMMGIGYRQAYQWMEADREAERILMFKQRGIMRRIIDSNTRLMSAGYNKLIEEWKMRQNNLKEKLRFVIKALTDKDSSYILAGYNGLKQRANIMNGVGVGQDVQRKIKLIRRLTNQGYNLQVMAANGLKEFLASERAREEAERLEFE